MNDEKTREEILADLPRMERELREQLELRRKNKENQ